MLTQDDYRRLAKLATEYRDKHFKALKQAACFNPRLGVDALCFQQLDQGLLVGALITPTALWLVALPVDGQATLYEKNLSITLPSGTYRLHQETLGAHHCLWKRCILEDLGALETMEEAARLAQSMMSRLMEPPA
ncbi:[NiFe]-hydrogenase assembly chaperone HybE [Vreelandella rituensis]|uniref:[NiFe]-hydrogenase assembly, chaperone, HybE n=1 Tax=Vreelandella rituensis TaxID=2282306 RepID=A0A368U853_9GAMM|nr:[NiFe]-hydrogenase assembly chaperone HybE [Halomonas rituensis]RCV93358.1 [NiFe]-hydrogenase assembly, chaperone, HybE [Halomonas rituensis]